MSAERTLGVPLRARDGSVRTWALLDARDGHLAEKRWHRTGGGYAARYDAKEYAESGKRTAVYMHREVLGVTDPALQVDHINRDRLDNRRENLRVLPAARFQAQNMSSSQGATSGHRGVSWDRARGKWRATAMVERKNYDLGRYETEAEAAAVAAAFRAEHALYSVGEPA